VQAQGRINNSAVQQLCQVSKATATRYLSELEKENYLHKTGITGAGTGYTL
jgi:ATP-dependent DNA helicase RecG